MSTPSTPSIANITIRFTADVFLPDDECDNEDECTCTNVYGDGTEHGHGETMESGWYDPRWSRWEVFEDKEDVSVIEPDSFEIAELIVGEVVHWYRDTDEWAKDYRTVDEWVTEQVEHVIGCIENSITRYEDVEGTYYAADPDQDYYGGRRAMLAAHVERN